MTCDHTAGLDVRSELVYDVDDLSGLDAHKYVLAIQAVTCKRCGLGFGFAGRPDVALRLDPPRALPAPIFVPVDHGPAITVDDLELVGLELIG